MHDILQMARLVTAAAKLSGALIPIDTDRVTINDNGIDFVVRMARNLGRKKSTAAPAQKAANQNPFLPYEQELWVSDIGMHHAVLLNKFNVIDNHLLIVTKHYEHQDRLLTTEDLTVIADVVARHGGLGFYNGGTLAGASQHHKHLQWIPGFELHGGIGIPMLAHLPCGNVGELLFPDRPFPMALAKLADNSELADQYIDIYQIMTRELGIDVGSNKAARAYNLLLTKSHMWMVARVAESFESISLNAMAFAGSLFVKDTQQLEMLKAAGPLAALRHTAALKNTSRSG